MKSKTDRRELAHKGDGRKAKLSYNVNLLMENRDGPIVDATVLEATGNSGEGCRLKIPGQ